MSNGENSKDKIWSMVCHLIGLLGFIGVPFGHLLGPLVVWLAMRKQSLVIDQNGKESLNFQITMTLCGLVAAALVVIYIGIPLLFLLVIADVVFVIIAAVSVYQGKAYRYPFAWRIIS